jgi:hypothetical protein
MITEYWVVRINYNQIDRDHVLVDAATAKEAEQRLRDNGCNAPYIKAMYKAKVANNA